MTSTSTHDADATTPPPGRWAQLRSRLQPPRYLSLTRAGKFFILMTLAVGFGAINTENNLLFLLFGMMLSLIIASGLLSEAVLRHLRLRRRFPNRIEAGQPAPGTFLVTNRGWWPALSVEASEQNPVGVAGPAAGQTIGPRHISWWKFWKRQTDDERRPMAAAYSMRIQADDESQIATHYKFPQRGRFQLPGLQLTTRFPFELFEKSRHFSAPATVTVLPDAAPARQWLGALESQWGNIATNQRGRGEEYFGLRDYRPGEDRRAIHWKSTARRGEPVVRETEARQRHTLLVIFDNRAPVDEPTPAHQQRFEQGVRHLAGMLEALQRMGYRVQLLTGHGHIEPDNPGTIEPLLRHLAVVELLPVSHPPPAIELDDEATITRIRIGFDDVLGAPQDAETRLTLDALSEESS